MSADGGSLAEAAAVAVFGGMLGVAAGWPIGLSVPFGVVAAANGAVSGWRRVYDWRSSKGAAAVALDSTWALPMTVAALFANAVGAVTKGGYVSDLSHRANRHVYQRGFMPRKGFAITLGNVISGAADTSKPRRRRLITDHEDVHVWQARWLGPLYPIVYVGWMAVAGAVGALAWALRHRDQPIGKVVETYAYYLNPLEWWAYSRDDHWRPGGMAPGIGWKRPAVRSFSSLRRDREAPTAPH
jgi:hypothetical protein